MKIKRNITTDLHKRSLSEDYPVRMRVTYSGNRIEVTLPIRIKETDWANGRMVSDKRGSRTEVLANNTIIAKYIDSANAIFNRYELIEQRIPPPEEFRKALDIALGKDVPEHTLTFYDVFDLFVKNMGVENSWSKETYTKFGSLRKHLIDFNPKLSLDVTEDTMKDFVAFLTKEGLRNTTVAKAVSYFRWFLRWAFRKGYYKGIQHDSFRPRLKGITTNNKLIVYLSWKELTHLYNLPIKQDYLDRVRDVFCFCCFSSLRYSDVKNLRRSDITDTHITIVTRKTVDRLKIDLNNYTRAILDKYKKYKFPDDLALPVISNAKMNSHLKELGQLAGFKDKMRVVYFIGATRHEEVYPKWALLTTHCGRRTFIVIALYLGIPAEVVMKFTGHADFKAMQPYVEIVDALKSKEMDKFNK